MTIFNNVNPGDDNQQEESISSYLEALVGDGKKFKDQEALAKAKWEADKHIARLERERQEDRIKIESHSNLEELVSKLASRTNDTSNSGSQNQNERQEDNSDKIDIAALVEQTIERKTNELSKQNNIRTVSDELRKAWGPDYVSKLKAKAQELELSESFIDDAAAKSPKAVLALLLSDEKKNQQQKQETTVFSPPRSSVNTSGMPKQASGSSLKEYYSKMRKENPKKYHSPEIHAEMLQLVVEGKLEF